MESPDIQWKSSLEELVRQEAEKASAHRWAHDESQRWTAQWNTRLTFICIILSTVSGAGAVGASQILPFEGSTTLVGIISLVVGTLQTISNFLAFAKRAEAHRIASLSYGKIHSTLSLQLSLPRNERQSAEEIIDYIKTETERLAEISPQYPQIIKDIFHKRFHSLNIAIPSTLNGIEPVKIISDETISATSSFVAPTLTPRPTVRLEV
jgi:hypothetical protein